jgi:hypothetical protein
MVGFIVITPALYPVENYSEATVALLPYAVPRFDHLASLETMGDESRGVKVSHRD